MFHWLSTAINVYVLHPLVGPGYQLWSGVEAAAERPLDWLFLGALYLRRHNCAAPRCLRIGRHPTADHHHALCRKHHPDLPDRKLTLHEIHARHRRHATRDPR